jgi:hypothetical protein
MQPKRRRLVAETADDLQHILFGDSGEGDDEQGSYPDPQTAVAIPRTEPEDVEVFSDSDRDSMDEFIVRDTNEDREQKYFQNYAEQYGEDATEMLGDVIAVFGDLRILDLYSRDSSKYSRISPKKGESLEEKFDPEEVLAHFASKKDEEILSVDCPERMQEDYGATVCLETFAAFESDPSSLEEEWMIESRWIYAVLVERLGASTDWTFWTPVEVEDKEKPSPISLDYGHSAISMPDHKSDVLSRINVALRDMRGRGLEPIYLWYSMSRAKYEWFLNLSDLIAIRELDLEWSKRVWPKLKSVRQKISGLFSELDRLDQTGEPSFLAEATRTELSSVRSDLIQLISPDGVRADLPEYLDDFIQTLTNEWEPMIKYLNDSQKQSLISQILTSKFHENLIPMTTLSPREIGENLALGGRIHKGAFGAERPPAMDESVFTSPATKTALIEYLSSTIASNVRVRKWFRSQITSRLAVSTHPVNEENVNVACPMYAIRRLVLRPLAEMAGTDVFASICHLAKSGEIKMDLCLVDSADSGNLIVEGIVSLLELDRDEILSSKSSFISRNMNTLRELRETRFRESYTSIQDPLGEFLTPDPLLGDLLHYMQPAESRESSFVHGLRVAIAKSVVSRLYKSIKADLSAKFLRDSTHALVKKCGIRFSDMIRMGPFDPRGLITKPGGRLSTEIDREIFRRKCGKFSVLSGVVEKVSNGFRSHLVIVNHKGETVDQVSLDHFLGMYGPADKKESDKNKIISMVKRHFPALAIVGADDRKSRGLFAELKTLLQWPYHEYENGSYIDTDASRGLSVPSVHFGDLTVPSMVARNSDENLYISMASSLGRFQQSPLAETLRLWSDFPEKNPVLSLNLTGSGLRASVQSFVPKTLLHRELRAQASLAVCDLGAADLNAGEDRLLAVLGFVPGLGPRKARKLIGSLSAEIRGYDGTKRLDMIEKIIAGRCVFRNAQPFLRLAPDVDKLYVVSAGVDDDLNSVSSASSSSSSSSSGSSASSMSVEEQDESVKDPVTGEWAKEIVEAVPEWTQDPVTGEWTKSSVEPVKTADSEWVKDPVTGEWTQSSSPAAPTEPVAEWTKDPVTGEWVQQKSDATVFEWTKDPVTGEWKKNGSSEETAHPEPAGPVYPYPVSHETMSDCMEGCNFFELCRFSKECWPVLVALLGQEYEFWANLGKPCSVEDSAVTDLVDEMFDRSDVPAHLIDPEIDRMWLKSGAKIFIKNYLFQEISEPYSASSLTYPWRSPTRVDLFYAFLKESRIELHPFSVVNCSVTESSRSGTKVTELATGISNWLTTKDNRTWFYAGDSVRCRVKDFDYGKLTFGFTTEGLSEKELADTIKHHKYLLVKPSDFAVYDSLGKIQAVSEMDASRTLLKTRRIIKHENYFEIPHAAAVERLADAPIGEVIFRPSLSNPGQYMGLIKCKGLSESRDPSKEDWIKIFRFIEGPSAKSRVPKTVFKLVETGEEFEEFDQMKVAYVDKYLRNLHELRNHPKFRPESNEQVVNLVKAKTMAQRGTVAYALTLDERREFAGNALLLWAVSHDRVYQDPIEISNKGFKWWTKGPYAPINALLNWWKQGGYKERHTLMDEWVATHKK